MRMPPGLLGPLLLAALALVCPAEGSRLPATVFQLDRGDALPPPSAPRVDPLAAVSPLFAHWPSRYTHAMDQEEQSSSQVTPFLQPNYEVNRPTRVLAGESNLKSCTVTLATKSFANRWVKRSTAAYFA